MDLQSPRRKPKLIIKLDQMLDQNHCHAEWLSTPEDLYIVYVYIILYQFYLYQIYEDNRLLSNSEPIVLASMENDLHLMEKTKTKLPCESTNALFCLSNVCDDCYCI